MREDARSAEIGYYAIGHRRLDGEVELLALDDPAVGQLLKHFHITHHTIQKMQKCGSGATHFL